MLIVGDVHGCYRTLVTLLDKHWQGDETLVFVGDLIDRGNFTVEVVDYVKNLCITFGQQVIVLLGNHEYEFIQHWANEPNMNWLTQGGLETMAQYAKQERDPSMDVQWFQGLPVYYENEYVFISHAGIGLDVEDPFDLEGSQSVIWNRRSLKNLGKLQVVGHTPHLDGPIFYDDYGVNIDSGAVYGGHLSAIKVSNKGRVDAVFKIRVCLEDIQPLKESPEQKNER